MKKYIFFIILILLTIFLINTTVKPKEENKVIIKFSSWGSKTEYSIIKKLISQYEENNPDVKIEFIHVPENYFRKLHLLYAAKTAPDVVFINNTYAPLYIKAGLLEDLSDYINENDFYKTSIDCFRYDNKIYAVPRDISNLVIYVNKDIVKDYKNINSVQKLREYAKKYTSDNKFGLNYEKNPLFWLYYLTAFNGGILSDDGNSVIINQPASIKGLELYADMINKDNCNVSERKMACSKIQRGFDL